MRLGVGLDFQTEDPEEIARGYYQAGYSAAICPPATIDQADRIQAIRKAFQRWDILLAEVGVWNNMLDPDPHKRADNLEANIRGLALADEVGAVCCVNIAGTYNPDMWDGPHPLNLSAQAFEETVKNVRQIIDAVKPRRARYSIEGMPWAVPDGPDSYLDLIKAIDRPAFACHLDPVNWVNCPSRFYNNAGFLRECFSKLRPHIVSIHAKDINLSDELTVHLSEARPGLGKLDYAVFLQEANRLGADMPFLLEHLPADQYPPAREFVLSAAKQAGVAFHEARPLRDNV
jgi:sugar phosphate isomerase/epimerase